MFEQTRMSIVVLDGSTVREFVEDKEAFNKTMDEKFMELDANKDGVLCRSELRKALESLRLMESEMGMEVSSTPQELNAFYDSVFDGFDTDHNNNVEEIIIKKKCRNLHYINAEIKGHCRRINQQRQVYRQG
jgi:hypothetical protein